MAVFKAELEINLSELKQLMVLFPDLNGAFLSYVGKRGREILQHQYLSGQEINVRGIKSAQPKDRRGKYLVSSSVNKRRTAVKISSYPMNLFERGRGLRGGGRERGKYVITRKLKQDISSGIAGYAKDFESRFLRGRIKGMGL